MYVTNDKVVYLEEVLSLGSCTHPYYLSITGRSEILFKDMNIEFHVSIQPMTSQPSHMELAFQSTMLWF